MEGVWKECGRSVRSVEGGEGVWKKRRRSVEGGEGVEEVEEVEQVDEVDEVDVHGKYYAPYPLLCTPTPADDFVIRNAPHHCLQPQHHGSNQCFGVFCRVVRHCVCKVKGVNKGVKGEQRCER